MLSVVGKDLSYWIAPESFLGRCRKLMGFPNPAHRNYFFTAVRLRRDSVVEIDNLI
jgi:hypothetical protein